MPWRRGERRNEVADPPIERTKLRTPMISWIYHLLCATFLLLQCRPERPLSQNGLVPFRASRRARPHPQPSADRDAEWAPIRESESSSFNGLRRHFGPLALLALVAAEKLAATQRSFFYPTEIVSPPFQFVKSLLRRPPRCGAKIVLRQWLSGFVSEHLPRPCARAAPPPSTGLRPLHRPSPPPPAFAPSPARLGREREDKVFSRPAAAARRYRRPRFA